MNEENKGIKQIHVDYGDVMKFEPITGSQITNERITDTYVTQSDNDDKMVKELDKMCTYLFEKRHGFAGFMAWAYAMMTMMYLMKKYDYARQFISQMNSCMDMIESHLFTGNYLNPNGTAMPFRNFSYGETDEELPKTLRFAEDSYNTSKLIHKKAGSFESGFSFLNISILYHTAIDETAEAQKDCKYMRELIEHLDKYLEHLSNNPNDDAGQNTELTFGMKDLEKITKKNHKLHFDNMDELSEYVTKRANESSVMRQVINGTEEVEESTNDISEKIVKKETKEN